MPLKQIQYWVLQTAQPDHDGGHVAIEIEIEAPLGVVDQCQLIIADAEQPLRCEARAWSMTPVGGTLQNGNRARSDTSREILEQFMTWLYRGLVRAGIPVDNKLTIRGRLGQTRLSLTP